jgi:hypothetical protein
VEDVEDGIINRHNIDYYKPASEEVDEEGRGNYQAERINYGQQRGGMAEREAEGIMVLASEAETEDTEIYRKFATRIWSRRKSFDRLPPAGRPLDSVSTTSLDEF